MSATTTTPETTATAPMTPAFVIYREGCALRLSLEDAALSNAHSAVSSSVDALAATPIIRICALSENCLLLLNSAQQLLIGRLQKRAEDCVEELHIELLRTNVRDVDYCRSNRTLYVVSTENGAVYTQAVCHEDEGEVVSAAHYNWQHITFDPLELAEEGIVIQRVKCSADGVLFITAASNDVYALGSCDDVFCASAQPQHLLHLFDNKNKEILDVAAGDAHFMLLLQDLDADRTVIRPYTPSLPPQARSNSASPLSTSATTSKHHKRNASTASANSIASSQASISQYSGRSSAAEPHDVALQQLLQQGRALLQTHVYSFGGANGGLLGTGDHIRRNVAHRIDKLSGIGVCAIAAGREHSIARTLDGRIFHWGLNSKQQLQSNTSSNSICNYLSAPQELKLNVATVAADASCNKMERSIIAACCGEYQTLLMNANGALYTRDMLLKSGSGGGDDLLCRSQMQAPQSAANAVPPLLASGGFTVHNRRPQSLMQQKFYDSLHSFQLQLQALLQQRDIIEAMLQRHIPLSSSNKNNSNIRKKSNNNYISNNNKQLTHICELFTQILHYLTAAVHSLERYCCGDLTDANELMFVRQLQPSIALFANYTHAYCDVRSVNGFVEAAKWHATLGVASAEGGNIDATAGAAALDLQQLFQQPFKIINIIMQCLELLSKRRFEFTKQLLAWQTFTQQQRIELELAESTQEFWLRNERNIKLRPFRHCTRRVILSSETVPLRLASSTLNIMPGTQSTFVLFSDCLCQLGGTTHLLQTFPLVAIWLKQENDKSLRITTPEKCFTLVARSQHDKMLWYDQLESAIAAALGRPDTKPGSNRRIAYVFGGKHAKYAGVDAYGQWRNGVLNGSCYLQFPNEKFYVGEVRHGEIEGYGKMVLPSVGVYEGYFKRGKFHGYGTYEMKDNEEYNGHFRDGLFHGHGMLRTKSHNYVGEFHSNTKSGYGIQDDAISGEKYMGMFVDNKRNGAGICVTMNGDYFEGIFVNGELTGQGIAVFENGYYYEGELTMNGPCGRGVYYMPHGCPANGTEHNNLDLEDNPSSKQQMLGNILSGQLTGTWNDVRILSGTMSMNRQFSKYPKSIGELVVDNSRKWRTLFNDFEQEICDDNTTAAATPRNTAELWNCIAVYINKRRERDKARTDQDTAYKSYFAKNISLGFSASMDKISLKSDVTNSPVMMTNGVKSEQLLDFGEETATTRLTRRSYSQETLYESSLCDLDFMNYTAAPITNGNDEHSFHNLLNAQLGSWATDSSNSLNTSFDSVLGNSNSSSHSEKNSCINQNGLDFVPNFGMSTLGAADVADIKEYLGQAFKDVHHPLYLLNQRIAISFYTSYGYWKVKPTSILAKQALREWESIAKRVYCFVRRMFPALPEDYCVIESTREVVSHITLLYPFVLSEGIYSTLLVLYANKYSTKDEMYRQNLLYAEKLKDAELGENLGLDAAFLSVVNNTYFHIAIDTLRQLQEKYSPKAMLIVIENCMQLITEAYKFTKNDSASVLAADSMMPLTLFLVLRAAVPHLGAELALLGDLTSGTNFEVEMNGFAGYCYTTLKASYEHLTAAPLKRT